MDDRSLDFLDQLVPGTPSSDTEAAPSMRQGQAAGRSLPPPPPSVVAAARAGRASAEVDIDIELGSASQHEVPAVPPETANHVPMPDGKARSGWPPAAAPRPPPPPSLRPLAAVFAPPESSPPGMLVASAPPPAPPRRPVSLAPPPPPPLPPTSLAPAAQSDDDAEEVDALPDSDDFADQASADQVSANQLSANQLSANQLSAGQVSADQVSADPGTAADEPWGYGAPTPSVGSGGFDHSAHDGSPQAHADGTYAGATEYGTQDDDDALPTGVAHPIPVATSGGPTLASGPPPATSHVPLSDRIRFAAGASAPPAPPAAPGRVGSSLPPLPPTSTARPSLPLPPPPTLSSRPEPGATSEWDDAPTAVYARDSLRPSEMPSAHQPVVSSLPPVPTVPGIRAPRLQPPLAPPADRKKLWIGGGLAAAAAVLGVVFISGSSEGDLVINVAGADGVAVDGIKVFVDGKLVCEDSPCQLNNLNADGHVMKVKAEGYLETPSTAVLVKGGETTIHSVELVKEKSNTGISIPKSVGEILVSIDGKELGPLPQRLDGLEAGTHTLRFTGSERFEPLERTVELSDGKILAIEPVKLPVRKGIAKFEAGAHADGAEITLDGKPIELPYSAELSGRRTHTLVATRDGFRTFEKEFSFEPGEAELELTIALQPEASVEEIDADETAVASAAKPTSNARRSSNTQKASSSRASAKATGGGKLTLLSVPASMVILDGKPIGKTPKRALSVSAGNHSVVFVHPTKGRKRASAKVASGGSKTVAVRF